MAKGDKVRIKSLLAVGLVLMLLMLLVPMAISATNGGSNYGFIPNSGEASVSKVGLVTDNAVARYWTAPRYGQLVDAEGNPSGDPFNVRPYAWRTSRIETDADGNGWTLNVGADAFLNSYPNEIPNYAGGYREYNATNIELYGLVGSVVRIQADTEGLAPTNNDHSTPLTFGTDDAVQVFPVGEKGDMPRAIAIEADGDVWIGFYGGKYFQKYEYDGDNLTAVGDPVTGNFSPYQATIDKNGILWFSSRNSNPIVAADNGIYYFDTQSPSPTTTRINLGENPYSILIDNSGEDVVVWATSYSSNLHKIEGYSLNMTVAINGADQLRGMGFDDTGIIWMASTANHTVCWYDPSANTSGNSGIIAAGATPVGVGKDAAGYMWAICRYDGNDPGFIAKFDPADRLSGLTFTLVDVGYRPYAYDYFITPPEGRICGYKYLGAEGEEGIEGWTIYLYVTPLEPGATPNATSADAWTATSADGSFCFEGLAVPGTYYLYEEQREGWEQIVDLSEGLPEFYEIELTIEDPDSSDNIFRNTPELTCFDETAWAAQENPGETRFVDQGNWGTYIVYTAGNGTDTDPEIYPLFAGQTHLAGWLHVYDEAGLLYVKYIASGDDDDYMEGYSGNWTRISEYHLHVVDEVVDFNEVRTYNKRTGTYTNPIPGQFLYSMEYEEAVDDTGWVPVGGVDISGFDDEIFIAAHGVMWWCGYPVDVDG
jgi:hypothetical protein